ncbi:MAG: HAMP domain-containing histidine kinase, partial [Solirubrobacterales bacterium]|nr:HAMP domain-containing histidine kinase [Solirubrobacterales bacterium]
MGTPADGERKPSIPRLVLGRARRPGLYALGGFGLRGRIVGAVLITTVVTLGVAALVLLPQLERSLRNASETALSQDIGTVSGPLKQLDQLDYQQIALLNVPAFRGTPQYERALRISQQLNSIEQTLRERLGTPTLSLIGYLDVSGHGQPVSGFGPYSQNTIRPGDDYADVTSLFTHKRRTPYLSFGTASGAQVVRAAIPVGHDGVLAVRKSIDEIPAAVRAVGRSFEVAAMAGLVLTALLAIPLAATLVRRLQRLRHAAQTVAQKGIGAEMPTDRARDEVGDLARSFAIMQRRLSHQEEARRAFVATASHELRTPLASLEGMLELVADDLHGSEPDLEDAATLLERARVQSRRLSRLAGDLLDLSRIDAEVSLRSEPVELGELGRAVLAEFELGQRERQVHAQLTGEGKPVWVRADPGKAAQILRILVDNALRVA